MSPSVLDLLVSNDLTDTPKKLKSFFLSSGYFTRSGSRIWGYFLCWIKVLYYVNKFAKCVFRPTPHIAWEFHVLFHIAKVLYKIAMIQDSGISFFLWSKMMVESNFLAFPCHFSPEVEVLFAFT